MGAEVLRKMVVAGGRHYQTDQLGYLLDPAEWNPNVGAALAAIEGIAMGDEHWTIVHLVRC